MCGIAGVYCGGKIKKQILEKAIEAMNSSQKNRGPDDKGVFVDGENGIAFGHRRLSILDLSKAGHQPLKYQKSNIKNQKGLVITFNGEIYNFLELKKELEKKGYKFKTKTDTEIILALYAEYGEKSFAMLRGMFAFGLWDGKNKKLFLVKDRYGIKPLYYYGDGEKLIFASTVKTIAESGLIPVEKNPQAFIGFLLFGSVPLPLTTLKNVFAVPAGHYLEIGADGKRKMAQYYEPLEFFGKTKEHESIKTDEAVDDIRNLLNDAVRSHLISDAPLGVFLSGGLDSSVIAAFAANAEQMRNGTRLPAGRQGLTRTNQRLITLSVIFDEKEFSEEHYSDLVAKKIGSDHRKIKITKRDFYDSFGEIFKAMDQPTIDGVNTFFIAKAAKQAGLKTVLSGLGADEIFLGYPHFRRAELLRKIQKSPKFLKMPLKMGNLFGDRYSKLSYFANDDILSFYLGIRGLFSLQETAKILDINLSEVKNFINEFSYGALDVCCAEDLGGAASLASERSGKSPRREVKAGARRWSERTAGSSRQAIEALNPVDLLSYLELKFYLQNQLLKDTDFMSMHHSVEVRVPFLDHKLVEYVSGLPPEIKLGNQEQVTSKQELKNINKFLLANAVRDLLPSEIFTRPKMGFTFPFQKWLQGEVNGHSVDKLFGSITKTHWSRFWARKVLGKFIS